MDLILYQISDCGICRLGGRIEKEKSPMAFRANLSMRHRRLSA